VKTIKLDKMTTLFHSIVQEIVALKKCDHPSIVKIHEIYKDKKKLHIVLDFVEGQELLDYIIKHNKLKESEASMILKQLLKSIRYIHSKGIIHRDLKPENIIINPDTLKLKLIDFGLSSYFLENKSLHTKVGTPAFAAPEVIKGDYGKEADLWSIGIICYVMLVGYHPFQAENMAKLLDKIIKADTPYITSDWK
jgi:calcium-dependent protein kinase